MWGSIGVYFTAAFVCPVIYCREEILQKEEVMLSIVLLEHSPEQGSRYYPIQRFSNFCYSPNIITCCEEWRHKELLRWQHYRSWETRVSSFSPLQ